MGGISTPFGSPGRVGSTISLGNSGKGTQDDPFIVHVDLEHSEANREFNVWSIKEKEINNYMRHVYHIRMAVTPGDGNKYIMTVRSHNQLEVQGPALSSLQNNIDSYLEKVSCPGLEKAYKNQAKRPYSFWLLIFPESIVFDNAVISMDQKDVKKRLIAFKTPMTNNPGIELHTMFATWEIADNSRGRIINEEAVIVEADLFD